MTFPAKIDTFHGVIEVFAATSIDGMASTKDSKNGEGLEKKLLHKKYVENMGVFIGLPYIYMNFDVISNFITNII